MATTTTSLFLKSSSDRLLPSTPGSDLKAGAMSPGLIFLFCASAGDALTRARPATRTAAAVRNMRVPRVRDGENARHAPRHPKAAETSDRPGGSGRGPAGRLGELPRRRQRWLRADAGGRGRTRRHEGRRSQVKPRPWMAGGYVRRAV